MSSIFQAALGGALTGLLATGPLLIAGLKDKNTRFLSMSGMASLAMSLLSALGFYAGGTLGSVVVNALAIILAIGFFIVLYKTWPWG